MSYIKFMQDGEFLCFIKPESISIIRTVQADSPLQAAVWIDNTDTGPWIVDGTPDEIEARIVACETQAIQTRGVDNKPMMYEEIAQLERSLLNEIAAHDVTKRRLAAQEREIERLRSNLYKDRVRDKKEPVPPQPPAPPAAPKKRVVKEGKKRSK